MICKICKSNNIKWEIDVEIIEGITQEVTYTICNSCEGINTHIYDWTCSNCGQTHSTENPYCDCKEQENQIE